MAEERLGYILGLLDGIANAPLTAEQRAEKAESLLRLSGVALEELRQAAASPGLPWHRAKAEEMGLALETWLEAVRLVGLPEAPDVAELVARIHRAEAAARLLAAGYRPQRDAAGRLAWVSPRPVS